MRSATGPAVPTGPAEGHRAVDIPALTGLRAFAAAAVVGSHVRPVVDVFAPHTAATVGPLLDVGPLGVDVFFVLSGFVIAHTYAGRLGARPPGALRSYLVARFARVYPLHLVTLLAWVVLLGVGAAQALDVDHTMSYTPAGFIGNLLMLQGLPGVPAWNFPAWSISCEFAAYLLFPLFAARLLRLRWATALGLAVVVMGLQLVVLYGLGLPGFAAASTAWPRIVGEFAAGALLWVVWDRVLRPRPGRWADAVVVGCLAASGWLLWQGLPWALAVPLLTAVIPAAACATGPVAAVLTHPVTRWGGRVSYALYLVHIPVLAGVLWLVPVEAYVHHSARTAALVLGGLVLALVAGAALLHHGVEEPARRLLRRPLDRVVAPTPSPGLADAAPAART